MTVPSHPSDPSDRARSSEEAAGGGGAAPGWYADGSGRMRWWDGSAWGQVAPPPAGPSGVRDPVEAGRALATLAHLGVLAGGPILPLILHLTEGKKNPYVGHHAREGLNFQLTLLIGSLGAVALTFVSFIVGIAIPIGFFGFFALWGLMMLLGIVAWVFAIIGAVKAYQGVWWRYPIAWRLVG